MGAVDPTRQYRYSYSGSDARVWAFYEPGGESYVRHLESVHTISVSIHEAKGQARALGHRGIKGLSRGVRTIGGSMILTVVEDNPLRPLMEIVQFMQNTNQMWWPGWSIDLHELGTGTALNRFDYVNRMAPLLPPMSLLVAYVSEGAKWGDRRVEPVALTDIEGASLLIRGVEFIDEGIVTSINDIVSEVSLSFIATDVKPISRNVFKGHLVPGNDHVSKHNRILGAIRGNRAKEPVSEVTPTTLPSTVEPDLWASVGITPTSQE